MARVVKKPSTNIDFESFPVCRSPWQHTLKCTKRQRMTVGVKEIEIYIVVGKIN